MNKNQKRAAALPLLAKTGIWRSNYEPPLLRLLWRLGFDVPPPHFVPFLSIALFSGGYISIIVGFVMWLIEDKSIGTVAGNIVFPGLFYGLAMASYYAYCRHKYNLPSWKELDKLP